LCPSYVGPSSGFLPSDQCLPVSSLHFPSSPTRYSKSVPDSSAAAPLPLYFTPRFLITAP